jgi:hypothetical protein
MRTYTFTVKDKSYTLKYNFNAIVELEEVIKKPITSFGEGLIGVKDIRAIIYAGLKWENQGLTLDRVGYLLDDYIEEGTLEELMAKAVELISTSIKSK